MKQPMLVVATQNEFINETISLVSEKVFLEGRLNFIPWKVHCT